MGLLHCPLCLALAVLCAVRFGAHTLLIAVLAGVRPPSGWRWSSGSGSPLPVS